jgi:type IV pilus assembly protein PilE
MNSAATPRRRLGFTLSELLTALVVLVVLAAIAVPLWRNHLLRVRRADATAALIAVQNAQDQVLSQRRYAMLAHNSYRAAPPAARPEGNFHARLHHLNSRQRRWLVSRDRACGSRRPARRRTSAACVQHR